MTRLRYRLARWLVGPFFRLTENGSWIVNCDGEFIFAIRLTEWQGTMTTRLPSYDQTYGTGDHREFTTHTTEGTFTGRYIA